MDSIEQRAALERLIRERGEAYAGLSRLIGKNPSYIQQFFMRGSPKSARSPTLALTQAG